MAYELVKAMELLAFCMGWEWANDVLIREHLWPILKKWSTGLNKENSIKNASACVVMKIIGKADPIKRSKLVEIGTYFLR